MVQNYANLLGRQRFQTYILIFSGGNRNNRRREDLRRLIG
jgi:hypothetical protein